MKLSHTVCCTLLVAVLIGHSTAASINQPSKTACGSGATADYKGACDESVPVVVMPKGRPIMERILDWFKCDNKECQPESNEKPESSEELTTTPVPTTTTRRVTPSTYTTTLTTRGPTAYTTTTRPPTNVGIGSTAQ